MIDEDGQHALEMPRVQNQEPVQTLRPSRPHEAFRDPIRLRRLDRRPNNPRALGLKNGTKPDVNVRSLSRIRNRIGSARSASVQATCRACCVTHSLSGCAVQPARCTRRLAISMKNNTYAG